MNSGFYSAYAGFAARVQALDVVANNLANASTNGFKAQHTFYRSFSEWLQTTPNNPMNLAVNQYGVLGGTRLDLSQGTGFIAVLTSAGIRYTRDGSFVIDKNRNLVTQKGDQVLSEQLNGRIQPIQLPPGTGKMTISTDGSVSVDGALVAKLRIEDFAPGTQLTQEGASNLVAPNGAAKPATNVSVLQGSLEASNSDVVRSTTAILDLERTAQTFEKALSIMHNEFNKTAATDIGRI